MILVAYLDGIMAYNKALL